MAEKKGKGKRKAGSRAKSGKARLAGKGKGKAAASGRKKGKPGCRLLTPQEIIDYYRKNKSLPPEIQRRVGR